MKILRPVLDGTFDEMFPEDASYEVGDVVIPHPKSSVANDEKYLATVEMYGRPYLTVDSLKDSQWLLFDEKPMRVYGSGGDGNSWNPRFWILYDRPAILDEKLFTL